VSKCRESEVLNKWKSVQPGVTAKIVKSNAPIQTQFFASFAVSC
jgi:hypothetical protein